MNSQQFKNNGNQKFPLSTEALEFMQEQIKLVAGLTSLAGANIIVKEPTTSNGLVIFNGELLPLTGSKNGNTRIAIRVTQETLTVEGFDGNVRTNRVAYYTTTGGTGETKKNISDFTVLKSIATLMSELDEAKQHHMPKGSVIDWYGECLAANVPYGYVPCGWFGRGLTGSQLQSELEAWRAKYPDKITIVRTNTNGSRLSISACNGQTVPDLKDRFIVQAGHSYSLGNTGGETYHTLTVEEMPSHNHDMVSYNDDYNGSGSGENGDTGNNKPWLYGLSHDSVSSSNYETHEKTHSNLIKSEGSGVSHENRPPYYALYKLIKVI